MRSLFCGKSANMDKNTLKRRVFRLLLDIFLLFVRVVCWSAKKRWSVRTGLWIWIVLVACGTPELDTRGFLHCGTDPQTGQMDFCPEGWACRFGRCCPSGSDGQACPNIPGSVGSACVSDEQCQGNTCLMSGFPGGYCSSICRVHGDLCENGLGICVQVSGSTTMFRCFRACTRNTDGGRAVCRGNGYVCKGMSGQIGICLPE